MGYCLVVNTQNTSFHSTSVQLPTNIFNKVFRNMCEVYSHYLTITSFMCDTLYYWWYWTKGGAVLHLQEFRTNSITLFMI